MSFELLLESFEKKRIYVIRSYSSYSHIVSKFMRLILTCTKYKISRHTKHLMQLKEFEQKESLVVPELEYYIKISSKFRLLLYIHIYCIILQANKNVCGVYFTHIQRSILFMESLNTIILIYKRYTVNFNQLFNQT